MFGTWQVGRRNARASFVVIPASSVDGGGESTLAAVKDPSGGEDFVVLCNFNQAIKIDRDVRRDGAALASLS